MPYDIIFEPDAMDYLRTLSARDRATEFDTVEKQLTFEPAVETRQQKRLRPNRLAPWELRIGTLRVFYDIFEEVQKVRVVGVGRDRGKTLCMPARDVVLRNRLSWRR